MSQTMAEAIELGFARRWMEYRSLLKSCRSDLSEIAIHDLRVSARRVLGALDVIRAFNLRSRLGKIRRSLKGVLDALDDLRDVQVMRLHLARIPESVAYPGAFVARLVRREQRLLGRARRQLEATHPSSLRRRVRRVRRALRQSAPIESAAPLSAVDELFSVTAERRTRVQEDDALSIHRARIAFKKFRYAAEMLSPILPGYPSHLLDRMHAYQGRLGDIHDMDVLLAELDKFDRKAPRAGNDNIDDLQALRGDCQARRLDLVAAYRTRRDELNTFWRPAPDQPFPWEATDEPVSHPPRDRRVDQPGGRGQPATRDRQGAHQDVSDRPGVERTR